MRHTRNLIARGFCSLLRVRTLFLLSLALFLAGCVVSENPLGTPGKTDERMLGAWQNKGQPAWTFAAGQGGWMLMTEFMGKPSKGTAFVSELAGARFLNLLFENEKEKKKFYAIARYEIGANGALTLWSLDEKLVIEAINAGELKGTVTKKGRSDNEIALTDTSERLLGFVKKHGAEKAFSSKPDVYTKKSK